MLQRRLYIFQQKNVFTNHLYILTKKSPIALKTRLKNPSAEFVYFREDERKSGGDILTFCGNIRRIDPLNRTISFTGGEKISIDDVLDVDIK